MSEEKHKGNGWKIGFFIVLLLLIIAMAGNASKSSQISSLQNQLNQAKSTATSGNQSALQKCIGDAQQLNTLDPNLYPAANLQAAVSACQAKYPTN